MERLKIYFLILITLIYNTQCQGDFDPPKASALERDKLLSCAEMVSRRIQQDNV